MVQNEIHILLRYHADNIQRFWFEVHESKGEKRVEYMILICDSTKLPPYLASKVVNGTITILSDGASKDIEDANQPE